MIKHKVEKLNKVEELNIVEGWIYVSFIMPRLKQYFKILKKKKIVINLYFKNLRIMLSSVSVYNAVITNLREGLSHMEAYINEGVRVNGNAMCLS